MGESNLYGESEKSVGKCSPCGGCFPALFWNETVIDIWKARVYHKPSRRRDAARREGEDF